MDRWLHSGFRSENTAFITLFILYFTLLFSQPAASMPAYPGILEVGTPTECATSEIMYVPTSQLWVSE